MTKHTPVLLREVMEGLNLKAGDIFLDGTLGGGGHSASVAEKFGDEVEIIGLDRDAEALARTESKLTTLSHSVYLRQASFRNLDEVVSDLGVSQVNAILLDLGISSDQLDTSGRGFSFLRDEPLEMQMEKGKGVSASEILNTWDEDTLELILRGFGEEKYSRRLAQAIVSEREVKLFKTTFDLVRLVERAVPKGRQKIHPATRTFQALRIAVNEELVALEEGLDKGFRVLASNGRFAVISFHSLEDRIVKNFFRDRVKGGQAKLINKKPIIPSEEETRSNPRSRSAKLRILEKL
jgi:16S rRNA (cytosine1402-N4)-methyltransferase